MRGHFIELSMRSAGRTLCRAAAAFPRGGGGGGGYFCPLAALTCPSLSLGSPRYAGGPKAHDDETPVYRRRFDAADSRPWHFRPALSLRLSGSSGARLSDSSCVSCGMPCVRLGASLALLSAMAGQIAFCSAVEWRVVGSRLCWMFVEQELYCGWSVGFGFALDGFLLNCW